MNRLLLLLCLLISAVVSAGGRDTEQLLAIADKTQGLELMPEIYMGARDPHAPSDVITYVYRVQTTDPGETYHLRLYNLVDLVGDLPVCVKDGYLHDEDGALIIDYMVNTLRGEPFFYFLLTDGDAKCAHARLVPYPRTVSKGARTVSVTAMDPSSRAFLVEGEGYRPGESVHVVMRGAGQSMTRDQIAGEDGKFFILAVADQPDVRGGKFKAKFVSAGAPLKISWPWGDKFDRTSNLRARMK